MAEQYILVTRPYAESLNVKNYLEKHGRKVLIAPVLEAEPVPYEMNEKMKASDAMMVTSARVFEYMVKADFDLTRPVIAVGDMTSARALAFGFKNVVSVQGDIDDLLAYCDGKKWQSFFYPCARDISRDMHEMEMVVKDGEVKRRHYKIYPCAFYKMEYVKKWDEEIITAFKNKEISHVMIFSKRSALAYQSLIHHYGLQSYSQEVTAVVMSDKIKKEIKDHRHILVAGEKTMQSLCECIVGEE